MNHPVNFLEIGFATRHNTARGFTERLYCLVFHHE